MLPPLPTANQYASAAPAAESGTDYELNDTDKTLTIKTAKGAAFWSANSANYLDYNVKLDADIDIGEFLWSPVGSGFGDVFTGDFDGQGHTITGLTVNEDSAFVGLFGVVNEVTMKNVGLINSSITGKCTKNGTTFAGGIVGFADGGTIANCYNTGTLTANTDKGSTNVGGITSGDCSATNCYYRSDCMTGTVDNNGTSLTDAQMKAAAGEPDAMIDKLNGWVNDGGPTDYYTWKADSTSNPTNDGYPIFRTVLKPTPSFTAVTSIKDVPTMAAIGIDLTLSGTVAPTNATNKTILWSVKNAGTTGATITGGKLKTTGEGTATVTATITNGATESTDYTQDFNITVKPAIATVSGKITAYDDTPVNNATVMILLRSGNLEATTDASGNYSIANVPYGIHNIVVSYTVNGKEVKLNESIVVNNSGITKDIKLNTGSRGTSVEMGSDTPFVAVDRLGYQYDANLTTDEITAVGNGGTATIKLVAIKKAATEVSSDEGLIGTIATGKTLGYFIDLRILKTVIASDNSTITSEQPQTTLANSISVSIPIPAEMQGKDGTSVYRVHSGVAQALQKDTPDANGEYFTISPDGKYVTAYVKNFSTYAIGYTGSGTSGGSSGGGGGSSNSYNTITATAGEGGSISPSGSVSVRQGLSKVFTFTPDSGYQISDVVVDDKSVGVKTSYTFENIQKSHVIKVTFKKSESTTQKTEDGFKDVTQKDWFYNSVMNAVEKGWFKGTSDTTFGPSLSTNRGMIATALWRIEKEPTTAAASIFKDVANGSWYYNGISWAQANKIVEGYGNGKFGPQDNITREQMASILYRYATFKGYDTSKTSGLDGFTDAGSISQYAKVSMAWAVENGLISGKGKGILDPKKGATRGEVATILTRFNNLYQK
ncbi:S-layer homology domain-containing protein [Aminipila terrae]|uniref:SLH domain-containing protein n=1 Tax=Aminipila terrae TaxID=2697030 RepID=A0A6P1MG63_9FIRM|nr:S-layer homology domain-containing protein [Aminipila terrae]QHI72173.1 hypothetical protein Ami3637_06945 [Aminipila terrae]